MPLLTSKKFLVSGIAVVVLLCCVKVLQLHVILAPQQLQPARFHPEGESSTRKDKNGCLNLPPLGMIQKNNESENDDLGIRKQQLPPPLPRPRTGPTIARALETTNCLRLATMLHTKSTGLGHKVAEIVYGMVLAQELNATYVFDDEIWFHEGIHGSYPWLTRDVLPLQDYFITTSHVKQYQKKHNRLSQQGKLRIVDDRWPQLVSMTQAAAQAANNGEQAAAAAADGNGRSPANNRTLSLCHVMFQTRLHQCCREGPTKLCYCTKQKTGAFEQVKWRMRQIVYEHRAAQEQQQQMPVSALSSPSSSTTFSVAWHLRAGDLVLNDNQEYFARVAQQVAWALQQALVGVFDDQGNNHDTVPPFVVSFHGENATASFPFLPSICDTFFGGQCQFPELNVQETLYAMMDADLLITSGSSFPLVAALFRSGGVILSALPKEKVEGVYDVSEYGLIAKNGTITKPSSLTELASQLRLVHLVRLYGRRN